MVIYAITNLFTWYIILILPIYQLPSITERTLQCALLDLSAFPVFFKLLLQGQSEQCKTNSARPAMDMITVAALSSVLTFEQEASICSSVFGNTNVCLSYLSLKHQPNHADRITLKTLMTAHSGPITTVLSINSIISQCSQKYLKPQKISSNPPGLF